MSTVTEFLMLLGSTFGRNQRGNDSKVECRALLYRASMNMGAVPHCPLSAHPEKLLCSMYHFNKHAFPHAPETDSSSPGKEPLA